MAKPRIIRMMEERLAREGKTSALQQKSKPIKTSGVPKVSSAEAFTQASISKGVKASVKYVPPLKNKKIPQPIKLPSYTLLERKRIRRYSRKYGMEVYSFDLLERKLQGSQDEREWAMNVLRRYELMAKGQYDKKRQDTYTSNYRDALIKSNAPQYVRDAFEKWAEEDHPIEDWEDLPDIKDLEYEVEVLGVEATENIGFFDYMMETFEGRPHTHTLEQLRAMAHREVKKKKAEQRRKRRRR